MNHLLSLAFGHSSSPGLSGGAIPSIAYPSFAELLTAPSTETAVQFSISADQRNWPATIPEGEMPVVPENHFTDTPDAIVQGSRGARLPDLSALPAPLLDSAENPSTFPLENPANARPQTEEVPFNDGKRQADETSFLAIDPPPSGNGESQPIKTVTKIEANAPPLTGGTSWETQIAVLAEPAKPAPETVQPMSEHEDSKENQDSAASDQSDGDFLSPSPETDAPEAGCATVAPVLNDIATSPPLAVSRQAVGIRDGKSQVESHVEDGRPLTETRNSDQSTEPLSSRPSSALLADTGGTPEFAKILPGDTAEAVTTLIESGSRAADLLPQIRTDSGRHAASPAGTFGSLPGTVSALPGEIGRQLGIEIVRGGRDGRDSLTIRLDPAEMGQIQIRLQFDEHRIMRAHVTADSNVALEMLRRDSAELVRALGEAGVRTDTQSFQFEGRGHSRGEQQGQYSRQEMPLEPDTGSAEADDGGQAPPQKLRTNGSIDLFA